ncbi:MAG: M23 family metallopeptidase [Candidatus Aminicenantes bacterium]|nr:MAG: M23 family metallopeptidase [Candidatus Aminicenantes bacterium]
MKKIITLFLLFSCLNGIGLFSLEKEKLLSPSGITVELAYRAFQPGEAIIVTIEEGTNIVDAQVRFLGRRYDMGKDEASSKLYTFVGLDLNIKSGSYLMEIVLTNILGQRERLHKDISVLARKFRVKKLWVREEFVTPPRKALNRIRRDAEIIRIIYGMITPRWLGEGSFILPCSGEVHPNFGERRIFNNKPRSPHSGVDISAPLGTLVMASNSGKVVFAGDLYYAGKTVIIEHGLGVFTFYCHFSKIKANRGDFVKKGDIIGEVGATGRVTGAHLHWSIKIFESRVDPFSLLSLPLE